jgi:hypothetical protein
VNRLPVVLITASMAVATAAFAQGAAVTVQKAGAPGVRSVGGEIQVRALVVELDVAKRNVALRLPGGRVETVDVPLDIKNLEQVRVGDELVVRYHQAVAARLEPAGKGIRERVESSGVTGAASGALPGVLGTRRIEVLATITALDRNAGTATLRGPKRTVTMDVPPGVDIGKLKVGDSVRAEFVEAALIAIERRAAGK